jgi:hypothetical protein
VLLCKKRRKEGCIMKKRIILVLTVLMLAAPAWAEVLITCAVDVNEVTVSYDARSEPNLVRGFALDITADSGATITDFEVDSFFDVYYPIYPGSIIIIGNDVNDYGSPICDPCVYPGTLPGLGSGGVTVEFGSLYSPPGDSSPNAPDPCGVMFKFWVDGDCDVTIAENTVRGGVVLTDPSVDPDVNSPGATVAFQDCMKSTHPDYAAWVDAGKPDCWCYEHQCNGDADGKQQFGTFWVLSDDVPIFVTAYGKADGDLDPNGPCANFDHKKQYGTFQVLSDDLPILVNYYGNAAVPPCSGPGCAHADPNVPCDANSLPNSEYSDWLTP